MNLEDTKKLIKNVIENEFNHILETQQSQDLLEEVEINKISENSSNLYKKLIEVAPEHRKLIDNFESESSAYWSELCRYYFKKGVIAGTTNLKFLEDTRIIELV